MVKGMANPKKTPSIIFRIINPLKDRSFPLKEKNEKAINKKTPIFHLIP